MALPVNWLCCYHCFVPFLQSTIDNDSISQFLLFFPKKISNIGLAFNWTASVGKPQTIPSGGSSCRLLLCKKRSDSQNDKMRDTANSEIAAFRSKHETHRVSLSERSADLPRLSIFRPLSVSLCAAPFWQRTSSRWRGLGEMERHGEGNREVVALCFGRCSDLADRLVNRPNKFPHVLFPNV